MHHSTIASDSLIACAMLVVTLFALPASSARSHPMLRSPRAFAHALGLNLRRLEPGPECHYRCAGSEGRPKSADGGGWCVKARGGPVSNRRDRSSCRETMCAQESPSRSVRVERHRGNDRTGLGRGIRIS